LAKQLEYRRLIRDYPIISEQMNKARLEIVLSSLDSVLGQKLPGDIVEFGCYSGTTSLFLRRLIDFYGAQPKLHVYDSFEGLPDKSIKDASVVGSDFKAGELKVSKRTLIKNFKHAGLSIPHIHKGWFADLREKDVPENICFAFLDGDFYQSIADSLSLVWPRLVIDGQMVVDDYELSGLPGVSRAVNEFIEGKQVRLIHKNNMAIITRKG
jgi:O-methyltransferase